MNDLPKSFETYLRSSSLSDKTIRNYLSDVSHFWRWVSTLLGTNNFVPHLTTTIIERYKFSMGIESVPARTINRRLSTVRLLGKYLQQEGFLSQNPAEKVTNMEISDINQHEQLLSEYRKYLEEQKISNKTAKNYVSDIRSFFNFSISTNHG